MKPENITFLEANRHHWDTFQRAQFIQHLDSATRERFLQIIREEFNPGYLSNLWCSDCVIELLKFVYTQYDKWLEAQPKINS